MAGTWPAWAASLAERGRSVALGQAIALLVAGTGVTSTLLANRGVSVPTSQGFLNYLLLLVVYLGSAVLLRGPRAAVLSPRVPWYWYALLALVDVEANYLVVKAYAFTSITSIQLIDCWTIPVAMALSCALLGAKYSVRHYGGTALCLAGLAVLVASDELIGRGGGGSGGGGSEPGQPRAVVGDLLCLAAATLYGVSNVGQELLLRSGVPRSEFLGLLGLYGTCISAVQLLVLERGELGAALAAGGGPVTAALIVAFAACLFAMYSLTAVYLPTAGAAAFNLSLVTADVWAVLAALLVFGESLPPLFFAALGAVAAGLIVYHAAPAPVPASGGLRAAPAGGDGGDGNGSGAWLAAPHGAAAAAGAPARAGAGGDSTRDANDASGITWGGAGDAAATAAWLGDAAAYAPPHASLGGGGAGLNVSGAGGSDAPAPPRRRGDSDRAPLLATTAAPRDGDGGDVDVLLAVAEGGGDRRTARPSTSAAAAEHAEAPVLLRVPP